jgi:hypothetical protein
MSTSYRTSTARRVVGALLALSAFGCAHRGATATASSASQAQQQGTVAVQVHNQNTLDVDVFAVQSSGVRTRLGTVTSFSTKSFSLGPSVFGTGNVRIVADAIGSSGSATSGALSVFAGQTIDFTVMPSLRQSYATVR